MFNSFDSVSEETQNTCNNIIEDDVGINTVTPQFIEPPCADDLIYARQGDYMILNPCMNSYAAVVWYNF